MKPLLLVSLMLSAMAYSQVAASFSPQAAQPLPGVTAWGIQICAPQAVTLSGGLVLVAAQLHLRYLSRAQALAAIAQAQRKSPWRLAAQIAEYLGLAAQPVFAAGYPKLKEPWLRSMPGSISVGLAVATALVKQQAPPDSLPADYLPPFVQIPAPLGGLRTCAEYSLWATAQQGEAAFTVTVN